MQHWYTAGLTTADACRLRVLRSGSAVKCAIKHIQVPSQLVPVQCTNLVRNVFRLCLAMTVTLAMVTPPSRLQAASAASYNIQQHELPIDVFPAAILQNLIPAWSINEPQLYRTRKARRVPRVSLLRNFDRVSQNVYRGGQPQLISSAVEASKPDGIALLRAMGVTDLIDLRGPSPERTARQRARCKRENITYHVVPLPSLDLGLPLFNGDLAEHLRDVAQAVALIKRLENSNRVVYVHCAKGADRTSVVIAMLRLLDGASLDVAMSEADDHSLSFFQKGMRRFIKRHARPNRLAQLRQLVRQFYDAPLQGEQPTKSTLQLKTQFKSHRRTYDVYLFEAAEAA